MKHARYLLAWMLLLLTALAAAGCCGGGSAAVDIPEDDAEIAGARYNARMSIGQFIVALGNPRPDQTLFAVKTKFTDGEQVEYMWLTDLKYENGKFVGVVDNTPTLVGNVRRGDTYSISAHEVDDWMIVENEQIVGGFSVNVVNRRQFPEEEAVRYR